MFADRLPVVGGLLLIRLIHGHKKEARESVLVTRPALRGSSIAHQGRTSNAEAHAEYALLHHRSHGNGKYTYPT